MKTWLIPWLYVVFVLGTYLLAPRLGHAKVPTIIQSKLDRFLLVAVTLVITGLVPVIFWRPRWLPWIAWLSLIGSIVYSVRLLGKPRDEEAMPQDDIFTDGEPPQKGARQ